MYASPGRGSTPQCSVFSWYNVCCVNIFLSGTHLSAPSHMCKELSGSNSNLLASLDLHM